MSAATIRRLAELAAVAALVAVALLLASGRSEATSYLQAPDAEDVYRRNCSPCHGPSGEGGVGPGLQRSTAGLEAQIAIITNGVRGMPAFGPSLTEEELQAVAAFSVALQTPADVPGSAQRGAEVYEANCATCHGVDAEGGAGPNLTRTSLSAAELESIVREGQGTMPGFASVLAADDVASVLAYIESVRVVGEQQPTFTDPSLVARGANLFTINCSQCHGPDASGGAGPGLNSSLLTDAELVSVVSNGRGAMPGFSAILDATSIDAVVAYVDAARAAAGNEVEIPQDEVLGRQVYVVTCATCHALDGSGGLGPSLADLGLDANEIISRVFGGHPEGMPAFEGVLDAVQVKEVAQYILTLEGDGASEVPWVVWVVVAVAIVAVLLTLWYWGAFDRLFDRFGKSSAAS
jgi:mono/diheme cytochrome c family protein